MASRVAGLPVTIGRSPDRTEDSAGSGTGRAPKGVLRFGSFELDFDRYELRREGASVAVEPRTFDLLALLARNRGRTVTRDQILREIWPGRFVSDAALSSQIRSARKALGDDGTRQAIIATVHGRGFRLRNAALAPDPAPQPPGVPDHHDDPATCVVVLPCDAPATTGGAP